MGKTHWVPRSNQEEGGDQEAEYEMEPGVLDICPLEIGLLQDSGRDVLGTGKSPGCSGEQAGTAGQH